MTQIIGHQFAGGVVPAVPFASDEPGEARLPRRDELEIASGASSSRSAGDDCRGATGNPHAVQPPLAPRADLISIYITTDTADLLAVLAAEYGESLGGMIARLVVADIQSKGGIGHV